MIRVIGVCRHSFDHPITELWQKFEVWLLHIRQLLESLALLFGLIIAVKKSSFHCKICDDIIRITAQLDPLSLLVELVQFILNFFTPVEVFRRNLPVLVHIVQLHKLHNSMRPIQVYQMFVLIVCHEVAIHCKKAHSLNLSRKFSLSLIIIRIIK